MKLAGRKSAASSPAGIPTRNIRFSRPVLCALSYEATCHTEECGELQNTPDRTRTCNLTFTRGLLYPIELRAHSQQLNQALVKLIPSPGLFCHTRIKSTICLAKL